MSSTFGFCFKAKRLLIFFIGFDVLFRLSQDPADFFFHSSNDKYGVLVSFCLRHLSFLLVMISFPLVFSELGIFLGCELQFDW